MKNIITLTLLALATFCAAQSNQVKTPGVSYSAGAPNWVPVVKTAGELAIDTVTKRLYLWNRNTATWDLQGRGVDQTSGATPPAYTPGQTDSYLAINNATPPELYAWTGSAWAKVGGTIQTIDTFSVSGSVVSLSLSGDNQPTKTITLPASGITALTGDVTATGPGSAVATIATGAVSGAKLAGNSVDSTKVAPLSIANSDIANVAPEKLLQKGASTGQVLGWNGSVWGPTAAGSGWGLTGNAATAGSSFLGTTNLVSLRFRTNNVQRMIVDSLGNVGVGVNQPLGRFHVVGSGITSSTSGLQVHNSTGTSNSLIVNDAGWIGMGTATMGADKLDIQGTSVSDGPAIGAELATTATGTGWTGTSFATGYSDTGGAGTGPLTATGLTISSSALYQVTFTVTARTAGSFVATLGGITSGAITATGSLQQEFTSSTNTLVLTPTADFDGTIIVSVRRITATTPVLTTKASDGTARLQIRHANAGATIVGNSAGQFASLTGTRKTFIGTAAGQRSTTGISTTAVGSDAASANSTGSNWTAVGAETAIANRTGGNWTGIGVQAGNANTVGGNWTAIGYRAGYGNTLYSDWVAIGRNAAPQVHFQNGVYIGGGVSATEGAAGTPTTNEVVIGYAATGLGSNTTIIGNTTTTQTALRGSLTLGSTTLITSALLSIESTTKGFLPPRMTAVQASAITSPAEGLMLYVTTTNATFLTKGWYGYNGAAWEKLNN